MLQNLPGRLGNHLPLARKKGLQKRLVSDDERRTSRQKGGRLSLLDHPSMRRRLWTLAHLDLSQAAAAFFTGPTRAGSASLSLRFWIEKTLFKVRFCTPDAMSAGGPSRSISQKSR
jgi:hypothetical protein